jgi:hypothetical protein
MGASPRLRSLAVATCFLAVAVGTLGCKKLLGKKQQSDDDAGAAPVGSASAAGPTAAEAKLLASTKKKIETVREREDKLPARVSESLKPLDNGKIVIGGEKPNVAIVWVVPDSISNYDVMDSHFDESGSTYTSCSLAQYKAKDNEWSQVEADKKAALPVCAGFKYVLFARVTGYKKPEDTSDTTFTAGSIATDLFLYNIDTGAPLGSFSARAATSKAFKARSGGLHYAAKDLGMNLQDAIAARWEKLTSTKDFPRTSRPE